MSFVSVSFCVRWTVISRGQRPWLSGWELRVCLTQVRPPYCPGHPWLPNQLCFLTGPLKPLVSTRDAHNWINVKAKKRA